MEHLASEQSAGGQWDGVDFEALEAAVDFAGDLSEDDETYMDTVVENLGAVNSVPMDEIATVESAVEDDDDDEILVEKA